MVIASISASFFFFLNIICVYKLNLRIYVKKRKRRKKVEPKNIKLSLIDFKRKIIKYLRREKKVKKFFKWEGNFCFCFSESMFRFKCITKVEEEKKYALCAI